MTTSLDRFAWTDENIDIATAGMRAGLSAGQIGLKLGCTRNTVIGKMTRMGVKSANAKGHKPGVPAPWKTTPKSRLTALLSSMAKAAPKPNMMTINARKAEPLRIPAEKPVEASSEPPPTAKSFDELLTGECRWPFGDGTPYLFCAAPQLDGHSYCLGHCSIAHRPTPRRTTRERYEEAA